MSYTQFGYSAYPPSPQLVVSNGSSSPPPCCDRPNGVADQPSPGSQAPCPGSGVLQPSPAAAYDSRLLTAAAATYPRLATAGFYGGAAYPTEQAAYPNLDPSAFYPALNGAYSTMKDAGDHWRSITQPTSYYYDPSLAYGYGGLDFNGTRRKNVTRDSTSTLKAWLNEHRKNPYPTKGEKIMLAIITKMTLTQVSTWFANARRRLKKENKMTWEPRNKIDSDDAVEGGKKDKSCDDDDDKSDAEDSDAIGHDEPIQRMGSLAQDGAPKRTTAHDDPDPCHPVAAYRSIHNDFSGLESSCSLHHHESSRQADLRPLPANGFTPSASSDSSASPDLTAIDSLISSPNSDKDEHRLPYQDSDSAPCKPKIWSLADTATSKSPPPPPSSPLSMLNHFNGEGSPAKEVCPLSYNGSWFAPSTYHHRTAHSSSQHFTGTGASGYNSGISPPHTDTPPQTPPNLKVSTAVQFHLHGQSMTAASYLSSQASHLYLGQCSSTSVCGTPHLATVSPVEKTGGLYAVSHVSSRTPTLHGYRNSGDFQSLTEDYIGTQ